ncbi:27059_t:CDS:1, partial [Gigaspora margarita]
SKNKKQRAIKDELTKPKKRITAEQLKRQVLPFHLISHTNGLGSYALPLEYIYLEFDSLGLGS